MAKARLVIPAQKSASQMGELPDLAIYHITSRVVHRGFLLKEEEREQFRVFLRMYERFSGCRVLSYCVMTNHFHILLEVPPGCEKGESLGLSDEELLRRLGGLYSRSYVAGVERKMEEAKKLISDDWEGAKDLDEKALVKARRAGKKMLQEIHVRYSYRMHSLSEFMKGLLQRFTRWFNKKHGLRGTLWEERFHSVIVQDGLASRMMAAYIDLNPVRAGICKDPADYRWSSYGEAVGGGRGRHVARAGLVRALHAHQGREGSSRAWAQGGVSKEYRRLLVSEGIEGAQVRPNGQRVVTKKGQKREVAEKELARLAQERERDLKVSKIVRCQVRYFVDGAAIGSRSFVDQIFKTCRDQFQGNRETGARKPRGALSDLKGEIWSLRDLQRE